MGMCGRRFGWPMASSAIHRLAEANATLAEHPLYPAFGGDTAERHSFASVDSEAVFKVAISWKNPR